MRLFHCSGDIQHGKKDEHERLDETGEYRKPQHHSGDRKGHQHEEYQHDQVLALDIPEQTKREGYRTGYMAYDLYEEHHRREPQDRPHKMLYVMETVLPDADHMGGGKYGNCAGRGGVKVCGRGLEPWDYAQEVTESRMKNAAVPISGK